MSGYKRNVYIVCVKHWVMDEKIAALGGSIFLDFFHRFRLPAWAIYG